MKQETKVGILFVIFLVSMLFLGVWLKGNPFKPTYNIDILFPSVHGLYRGSIIEYEGFRCGKVVDFHVAEKGIIVTVLIDEPEVKIHQSDRFLIIPNSTIASEFQIFVEKGIRPAPLYKKGMLLTGEVPPGFEDFLFGAKETLANLNSIMSDLRVVVKRTRGSIEKVQPLMNQIHALSADGTFRNILKNTESTTKAIKTTANTTNKILIDNADAIAETIKSTNQLSTSLNAKISMLDDDELRESIGLLKKNLENLNLITGSVTNDDIEAFKKATRYTKEILNKMQSPDDGGADFATVLMDNVRRIDRISSGIENSLEKKTLMKALTSKVPLDRKTKSQKAQVRTGKRYLKSPGR